MSPAAVDEDLLDARQRLQRLLAASVGFVGTTRQPATSALHAPAALRKSARAARGLVRRIMLRNTLPTAKRSASLMPASLRDGAQECDGLLEQQAAAVAGLAVRGDGAAVREAIERLRSRSAPASGWAGRRDWRSARSRSCRVRRPDRRDPQHVRASHPHSGADANVSKPVSALRRRRRHVLHAFNTGAELTDASVACARAGDRVDRAASPGGAMDRALHVHCKHERDHSSARPAASMLRCGCLGATQQERPVAARKSRPRL